MKKARINGDVRAPEIRLIGEEGEQLGIVARQEALDKAEVARLDLVEIAPNAKPPVCRIMDYGKYLFQQSKKIKTKAKNIPMKQINFRPGTEEEDYRVKLRKLIGFLEHGAKVKILIRFRGREMQHQQLGMVLMKRLETDLDAYGSVEQRPKLEGRQMVMTLGSKKNKE